MMLIIVGAVLAGAPILATMAGGNSIRRKTVCVLFPPLGYDMYRARSCFCLGVGASAYNHRRGRCDAGDADELSRTALIRPRPRPSFRHPSLCHSLCLWRPFSGLSASSSEIIGARNLPEIRSVPGAIFVLGADDIPICLSANVRCAFPPEAMLTWKPREALGASPGKAALKVLFAISRPALAGGLALALMEKPPPITV